MDALLMCGGRGNRLEATVEKPLFEIAGHPMIEHVRTALDDSGVDTVHAVVSPHVPKTRDYLDDRTVSRIETPGDGYVEDLDRALGQITRPVLTVATDLPLLEADAIDYVLDVHERGSLTVCVPVALKQLLGVSADITFCRDGRDLAPTGINIVSDADTETRHVTYDARFAVNVNRQSDARIAEVLA